MKEVLSFLLLLLPVVSFGETTDNMTTVFEEHFDGWLCTHTSGINATYEVSSTEVRAQTFIVDDVKGGYPCLRLKDGYFKITIDNIWRAHGNFNLSFKDYSSNILVFNNNKQVSVNPDGTYTINVKEGAKQIILSFNTDIKKVSYIDDIVLKVPTTSIITAPSADLSFTKKEMSANIGTTCSSPELRNPDKLPVKWYSSNQAIATVDESGNVTPHFIGTTTIYAIFEGNDKYAYQIASYQLTTRREPLNNEVYHDGFDEYIGSGGNGGEFKDNAYVGDYNFTEKFSVDGTEGLSKGYQCLNVKSAYVINDLEKYGVKNGKLIFRCAPSETKGKVLTVTLGFSDTTSQEEINMQWNHWSDVSIPISSTSQLSSISFNGSSFFLDEISIISDDFITIGSTGYATLYYSGRTLKVPTGITAYTMKVENGKIVRSRTYSEGETLPKATAVVMRGNPGKYNIYTSTDEGIIDDANQLRGSDTKTNTIGNDGDNFYLLANKDGKGVGFYWGAQNGAAFPNGEHKAYLAIPSTDIEGSSAKPCYVFSEDAATAIGKINENDSKPLYYTLDGKRCPKGFKGIVITNGRKTIKR